MRNPTSNCVNRISTVPLACEAEPAEQDQSRTTAGPPTGGPPNRPWSRRAVLGLVGITTLALLTVGFSWCSYRLQHTVIDHARVKGRVHRIGARLDGQIKAVEVEPGQRVVKDQVLIRLEDARYVAAALEAQAQVRAALKRLEVEKLSIEQARRQLALDVEHSESVCRASAGEMEAATTTRDKWEREYDRIASLIKSHVGSASDLDNATAERDKARALVRAAQERYAAAEAQCRLARVQMEGLRVREAGLEVLAADVELARQRLAMCQADVVATVMRAPADGWVIDRIVELGGSAKVGEPMMSLWLGTPWLEAWVDEKKLSRIKIGSPVDVTLTAFPDRKLRGNVEAIGVLADKELQAEAVPSTLHSFFVPNAMIPIRIAVPDDQLRLQPGLSALVGIRHDMPPFAQKLASAGHSVLTALGALAFPGRPKPGTVNPSVSPSPTAAEHQNLTKVNGTQKD